MRREIRTFACRLIVAIAPNRVLYDLILRLRHPFLLFRYSVYIGGGKWESLSKIILEAFFTHKILTGESTT